MKINFCALLLISVLKLNGIAGIRVEDVPEKGLQPEAAVTADGTVHLIYLIGNPQASEVRYTFRKPGEPWKPSLTVNSTAGSAIAIGSIRGPQLALEEKGTVHVLWNGAGGHNASHVPLWYARKTGDTVNFEKQRDLLEDSTALDGGASITADVRGGVFVVWHGNKEGAEPEESQRLVFVRRSKDSGILFDKAQALNDTVPVFARVVHFAPLLKKTGR